MDKKTYRLEKKKLEETFLKRKGKLTHKTIMKRLECSLEEAEQVMEELQHKYQEEINLTQKELLENQKTPGVEKLLQKSGLSEQEQTFCLSYLSSFNTTQAALTAGYKTSEASHIGRKLLARTSIKNFLLELKEQQKSDLYITSLDVVNQYAKIAFADITDFMDFGTRKVPLKDKYTGHFIRDDKGKIMYEDVMYANVKDAAQVDGQLIQEVKIRNGEVSLKLYDKLTALETLKGILNVMSDKSLAEAKLKLIEAQIEKYTNEAQGIGSVENSIIEIVRASQTCQS